MIMRESNTIFKKSDKSTRTRKTRAWIEFEALFSTTIDWGKNLLRAKHNCIQHVVESRNIRDYDQQAKIRENLIEKKRISSITDPEKR